jgi:hypothetical protein
MRFGESVTGAAAEENPMKAFLVVVGAILVATVFHDGVDAASKCGLVSGRWSEC